VLTHESFVSTHARLWLALQPLHHLLLLLLLLLQPAHLHSNAPTKELLQHLVQQAADKQLQGFSKLLFCQHRWDPAACSYHAAAAPHATHLLLLLLLLAAGQAGLVRKSSAEAGRCVCQHQ
jgi:hypothetical protein